MYTGKFAIDEEVTIKSAEELKATGNINGARIVLGDGMGTQSGEPVLHQHFHETSGKVLDIEREETTYDYVIDIPGHGTIAVYEEELRENAKEEFMRVEKAGLDLGGLVDYAEKQLGAPINSLMLLHIPIKFRNGNGALKDAIATFEDGKLIIAESEEEEPESYSDTVVGNLLIAKDGREGMIVETGYDADANMQYYMANSTTEYGYTFTIYASEVESIDF